MAKRKPAEPHIPIPFDEALRRMINTPPQHRTTKARTKPKKRAK